MLWQRALQRLVPPRLCRCWLRNMFSWGSLLFPGYVPGVTTLTVILSHSIASTFLATIPSPRLLNWANTTRLTPFSSLTLSPPSIQAAHVNQAAIFNPKQKQYQTPVQPLSAKHSSVFHLRSPQESKSAHSQRQLPKRQKQNNWSPNRPSLREAGHRLRNWILAGRS